MFDTFKGVIRFEDDLYAAGWSAGGSGVMSRVTFDPGAVAGLAQGQYSVDTATNTLYLCAMNAPTVGYLRLPDRYEGTQGDKYRIDFSYAVIADETGDLSLDGELAIVDMVDAATGATGACRLAIAYPATLGAFVPFSGVVLADACATGLNTVWPRLAFGRITSSTSSGRRVVAIRNPRISKISGHEQVGQVTLADIGVTAAKLSALSHSEAMVLVGRAMRDYMKPSQINMLRLVAAPNSGDVLRAKLCPRGYGGVLDAVMSFDGSLYRAAWRFEGLFPHYSYSAGMWFDASTGGEYYPWFIDLSSEGLCSVTADSRPAELVASGGGHALAGSPEVTFAANIANGATVMTLPSFRPGKYVFMRVFPAANANPACVGDLYIKTTGEVMYYGPGLTAGTLYRLSN